MTHVTAHPTSNLLEWHFVLVGRGAGGQGAIPSFIPMHDGNMQHAIRKGPRTPTSRVAYITGRSPSLLHIHSSPLH